MGLWQDFLAQLPQLLAYGLVTASVLALGAMGLALIYRILKFPHFAHGDLMTLGAYWGVGFNVTWGLPWPLAFPLAVGTTVLCGLAIERAFYRPLSGRGGAVLLISSAGMALVLRNLVRLFWGQSVRSYALGFHRAWEVVPGVRLLPEQLAIVGLAWGVAAAVFLFLRYTRIGKALRAAADAAELAMICGIGRGWTTRWTWVLSAGLAALAGLALGVERQVLQPLMGWQVLLPTFAAVVLGGLAHPYGALLGALVLGISQELFGFFWPEYRPAWALAVLIGLLLWRSQGLWGQAR